MAVGCHGYDDGVFISLVEGYIVVPRAGSLGESRKVVYLLHTREDMELVRLEKGTTERT